MAVNWQVWSGALVFGLGFHVLVVVLGCRVLSLVPDRIVNATLRPVLAPAAGLLVYVLAIAAALPISARLVPWVSWLAVAWLLVDFRRSREAARRNGLDWRVVALALAFAAFCFVLMLLFHRGLPEERDLTWSVYRLTAVTPGDSPQSLMQAQVLWHGGRLRDLQDFALFDRPLLAAYITGGALTAIGMPPPDQFLVWSVQLQVAYFALWIATNALLLYALVPLAARVLPHPARAVLVMLVLLSPTAVFHTIGAWPKPLAVYLLTAGILAGLHGRLAIAAGLAAAAFYAHGSFLLPLLALLGTFGMARLVDGPDPLPLRVRSLAPMAVAGVLPVAIWFLLERLLGGDSPLRSYYLFNVAPATALHVSADAIRAAFYQSTSPTNLYLLPWRNVLHGLLPAEFLGWVLRFGLEAPTPGWRDLGQVLRDQVTFQVPFVFGMAAAWLAWRGFRTAWRDRLLLVASCICVVLPFAAAAVLYRRNGILSPVLLLGAWIPLVLAIGHGMRTLASRGLRIVAMIVLAERALVLLALYPAVRYDPFHVGYALAVLWSTAFAAAAVLWWTRSAPARERFMPGSGAAEEGWSVAPRLLGSTFAIALAMLALVPPLLDASVGAGGFRRYGWHVDLMRWPSMKIDEAGLGVFNTRLHDDTGPQWWINTGQRGSIFATSHWRRPRCCLARCRCTKRGTRARRQARLRWKSR